MAQSQASDPASSGGLQEIVVTAQNQTQTVSSWFDDSGFMNVAYTPGMGVHLTAAGYAHILATHMSGRANKSQFYSQFANFYLLQALIADVISNGSPTTFGSGEMMYVADISPSAGGPVGMDLFGSPTPYMTVQVSNVGVDPNYPSDRVVLTSYPGLPTGWTSPTGP